MTLQEQINNYRYARRKETLKKSDQLTLGKLISKIEPIVANQKAIIKKYDKEAFVQYDFEYLFPTEIDSWRGSYNELALNYTSEDIKPKAKPFTVTKFLKMLKDTIGKEFTGYKGGEYIMEEDTPIWVANYGNSGNTAVVDVLDNEYSVILITGLRDF